MRISTFHTFTITIVLVLAASIHVPRHGKYNQEEYLQALQGQQQNFEKGINKLDESVKRIDSKVNQTAVIDEKISFLQGAIIDQEDQIFQLSTVMIPPLNLSTCNCEALSIEDRKKLQDRADLAIKRTSELRQKLDQIKGLKDEAQFIQMKRNAENQIFYLQTIKKVLKSNCTSQAILTPTVYQSNIYANNWILGNQGINDLVKSYIERSKKYDSITNCPKETPFYNGAKCISCSGEKPVFNMETQKCMACRNNTQLDTKLRDCVDNTSYLSNIFTSQPWVSDSGDTTAVLKDISDKIASNQGYKYCPKETPFVVDQVCVKCKFPQIYNVDVHKCIIPNKGVVYDANIHSLVTPMEGYQTNPKADNLLIIGDPVDIRQIPNCPRQAPFYDDITCIQCPKPTSLFNTATKRCVACSPQNFYNAETRRCETRQILYRNGNYSNLVGLPNQTVDEYLQKIVKLQEQHPQAIAATCKKSENSALTSCVQCADGEVFNVGTMKCVKCQNLNSEKKICYDNVYFKPNMDAANGTLITEGGLNKYLQAVQKNATKAVDSVSCQRQKPYSDSKKCLSCPKNTPLFNVSSFKCTNCPKKAPYNSKLQVCEQAPITYISSPEGANSLVGSSKEQVSAYLDRQQKSATTAANPQICPQETPYSNGKKCIACKNPTPLFDVKSMQCRNCTDGKKYIPETSTCGQCPKGTAYDQKSGKCVALQVKFASNPNKGNYTGRNSEEVKKYIQNQVSEGKNRQNVVVCPIKTPYSNNEKCIACKGQSPLFDINSLKCVGCQGNTLYNPNNYLCQSCGKGYIVNQDRTDCIQVPTATNVKAFDTVVIGENANIKDYQPRKDQLQCPQRTPFYNGQKCIFCDQGLLFNLDSKKCEKCPEGKSYLVKTHKCQSPSVTNPRFFANVITSGQKMPVLNQSVIPCPEEKPFYDGSGCIACTQTNYLFDLKSKSCTHCSEGTIFDKDLHKCIKPRKITNFEAGGNRIVIRKDQNYQKIKQSTESMKNIQVCPAATPYFDGDKCIDCELGEVFNIDINSCQSCPPFRLFNKKTHLCEEYPQVSNLKDPNWISNNPEKITKNIKQALSNGTVMECPKEKPFSVGTSCIDCKNSTSFNADTLKCQHCPQKQVIDFKNHDCVIPAKFVTDIKNAPNLVYDGISETEIRDQYEAQKAEGDHVTDCPKEKPYYNGATCISCTGTRPYFNMKNRSCQACEEGSDYNAKARECLKGGKPKEIEKVKEKQIVKEIEKQQEKQTAPTIDTDPSFDKLAANVFTHHKKEQKKRFHAIA